MRKCCRVCSEFTTEKETAKDLYEQIVQCLQTKTIQHAGFYFFPNYCIYSSFVLNMSCQQFCVYFMHCNTICSAEVIVAAYQHTGANWLFNDNRNVLLNDLHNYTGTHYLDNEFFLGFLCLAFTLLKST